MQPRRCELHAGDLYNLNLNRCITQVCIPATFLTCINIGITFGLKSGSWIMALKVYRFTFTNLYLTHIKGLISAIVSEYLWDLLSKKSAVFLNIFDILLCFLSYLFSGNHTDAVVLQLTAGMNFVFWKGKMSFLVASTFECYDMVFIFQGF